MNDLPFFVEEAIDLAHQIQQPHRILFFRGSFAQIVEASFDLLIHGRPLERKWRDTMLDARKCFPG